ncbi:MAG: FIST C-terminal domain-containing protein [Deltaproteobacteria bacterium]|jgi:hypothetical protein|nr:FIST C-terminal domain-containing protein [Deltaproteobacteria bacterium]
MIKTMTAFTDEVDDIEFAMDDLVGKLDLDGLLASSLGIVACNREFTETDVVKALCERLRFPVLGATTNACAVSGSEGNMAPLSILIMTSDDVTFRTSLTCDLTDDYRAQIREAWKEAVAGQDTAPALVLTFLPLLSPVSGGALLDELFAVAQGTPVFGTMAVTEEAAFGSSKILYDGEFYRERMGLVLIYGDVRPRFFLGTVSEEKYLKSKGVISDVRDGSVLVGVSGKSARDFLVDLGLTADETGTLLFPWLFPVAVDFNDGSTPILRAMLSTTPDGAVTLAGDVPVGATLSVSNIDAQEVALVAQKTLAAVAEIDDRSAVLLHSCAARYHVAEAVDSELEVGIVRERLDDKGGYMISFSAGEICPVPTQSGNLENRFHNFTIIACVI